MSSKEICQESRGISENSRWKNIKCRCKAIPRLKSFLYFYDLEKGCRIIAGFEALVSVIQILAIYYLANKSSPSRMLPDPFWITKIDRHGIIKRRFLYHTNQNFCMGLGLVTLLNSLLLLIGSKWGHQVCLFLWIYITLFTTLISNINNTLRNLNFTQAFITFPSLALEGYFALVVASLICKLHEKRDDCSSYTEMHSSDSEMSTERI
ncbi:uncharacterized protein LOC6531573 [Drosophila yakuba]|uniref:Uncharacterized protein, isoform A n=1 Tax=Drosophila yakuba TaxID=7245 RepID=B4P7D8_DROYA|nr:uncharacterized protein LOC6531573 [Drosophila yakuba]EDW92083.2 uncharacterized protein Dyak_GE14155, isoform A [Drosophila yakuba]